jgi:hypothetical protein
VKADSSDPQTLPYRQSYIGFKNWVSILFDWTCWTAAGLQAQCIHKAVCQVFPWVSSVLERLLSLYPISTLHATHAAHRMLIILPHTATANPFFCWIFMTAQLPSPNLYICHCSTRFQITFTRRTSRHCLGKFSVMQIAFTFHVSHNPFLSAFSFLSHIQGLRH